MSKIFDALENAQKEGIAGNIPVEAPPPPPVSLPVDNQRDNIDMEKEMIALYQTITAALPDIDHRSVLIVGSRSNEGTSTVARELARVVSLRLEKNVLLIDLDRSRPEHHIYTNYKTGSNIVEQSPENGVPTVQDSTENNLHQVEETNLYVMPLFQTTMMTPRIIESAKSGAFWEPLKERFDLIIVDSPPVMLFPDGPAIVSKVDGVILVVEAEKTKWQVALSVKEKIIKSGGTILGIAFNKRKYYIPEYIYKHL
jgi:protein-tyrosine kinase